jgi:hypothetical protein
MNSVRPRDRVRQAAFVSHVIMLVGGLMVAVAKYGKSAFRLGRRQLRFPRRLRGRCSRWRRDASFRDSIQMVFLLQRTGTALSMSAATFGTVCNIYIRNNESRCRFYHAHASDPASL